MQTASFLSTTPPHICFTWYRLCQDPILMNRSNFLDAFFYQAIMFLRQEMHPSRL